MKVSRLNSIEQYVISRETVSIDELCEVFGVSKNTIRRDLNELEQRGHITKVYGGVTATVPSGAVPTPIRSGLNQIDKSLIAVWPPRRSRTVIPFLSTPARPPCVCCGFSMQKAGYDHYPLARCAERGPPSTITSILSRSAAFTARLRIRLSACPRSKRCPPCVLTRRSWARPACR